MKIKKNYFHFLAQAGLTRLGWYERINQTIEPSEMLYAVGQGALAVECRASDKYILEMLQTLVCHRTQCRILAERSFLKTLGGKGGKTDFEF